MATKPKARPVVKKLKERTLRGFVEVYGGGATIYIGGRFNPGKLGTPCDGSCGDPYCKVDVGGNSPFVLGAREQYDLCSTGARVLALGKAKPGVYPVTITISPR
jgi:hypothetical protein